MLNSRKKIRALRDKKNKYSNSFVVRKNFLNVTKNHNPPFKLNGRSPTRSLVLCVCFVDRCFPFFFWHCVVCPSIYGF